MWFPSISDKSRGQCVCVFLRKRCELRRANRSEEARGLTLFCEPRVFINAVDNIVRPVPSRWLCVRYAIVILDGLNDSVVVGIAGLVKFSLLGPLRMVYGERSTSIIRPRRRAVLAYLLLNANRPVSNDRLVEALWQGAPPITAREQIQSDISALRRAIREFGDAEPIVSTAAGYSMTISPGGLDLDDFVSGVDQARAAVATGDIHRAADLVQQALGLWRGPALADGVGGYVSAAQVRLEEQRISAEEYLAELELARGHHDGIVERLAELAAEHPLREVLRGHLMLALYRCGRRAEALAAGRDLRWLLVEQAGLDPGPSIADLERRMLNDDPLLRAPRAYRPPVQQLPADVRDFVGRDAELKHIADALTAAASRTELAILRDRPSGTDHRKTAAQPRELPRDVPHFVGRTHALAQLDSRLAEHDSRSGGPAMISAIVGSGGVGKTALAVHWAHRVGDHFPDGQLYVNLRGFDPTGPVMPPAEAIRRFLSALAVPAERIPVDPDSQVSLFRTLLAAKCMLILLDNARDADQVRPLLPGAPGCVVVVTSRTMLTGLVAAEGAYPLSLDLLSQEESRELLSRRLGDLVATDPGPVDEIIACCARLPLALAIVAARAITEPQLSLAAIAGRLRDCPDRLDTLSTSDMPATDLRTVFSWSHQALGATAARLFTVLGLHPGPDISIGAAASLATLSVDAARSALSDLVRAHLIEEHAPGRYALHDLLRAYAAELAQTTIPANERRAATRRMLDHYLHSAYAADRLLEPARETISLIPAESGVAAEHLADRTQALAWFTAEHAVLRAAVDHAAGHDFPAHCWQLAWSLFDFFDRHGLWHELLAVHQTAVDAARPLADPAVEIIIYRILARACIQLGRFDEAHSHLHHALTLADAAGDVLSQANIHNSLGHLRVREGRHEKALHHARLAVDLFRAVGRRHGEANTLNGVGWCYAMLGDHQQALAYCQEALRLLEELDDVVGQAHTWDSLGYIHHQAGHHDQAVACYEKALGLDRRLGARRNEAEHLANLGDAHRASGNLHAARDAWQQALTVLEQIDHPDIDLLRTKLTSLGSTTSRARTQATSTAEACSKAS
jgi:DNA-binding SARP family transcriptional activator/tetratricopeptide (TPR) repeat protein